MVAIYNNFFFNALAYNAGRAPSVAKTKVSPTSAVILSVLADGYDILRQDDNAVLTLGGESNVLTL